MFGDQEINRLINQAVCWEPETESLFDQIGIQPGWKCIDLGCGPVGTLGPMSHRVGSSGQVIGLDSNLGFIHSAKKYIVQNQLLNVKIIKGDMYNTNLNSDTFNLTHERFIFSQFGCDQQLFEIMFSLTRPGGIIISQESDWTTWNCYPKNPSWEKLRNSLIALFEIDGGDINAAQRTYKMFSSKLANVQIRTNIKALPIGHEFRAGMMQMAVTLRDKIIAASLLTLKEFDEIIKECARVIADPNTIVFSYLLSQVWGYVDKPLTSI